MITIENNKECFVRLWLRLEPTRLLLEGQYKRFCVRNILRSWFGLRANDMFVWDVCSNSGLEGWQTLPSPIVCPYPLRDMLKAVVAVRMGISIKKVDVHALDAAFSVAFPNAAPLNVAHKKQMVNGK